MPHWESGFLKIGAAHFSCQNLKVTYRAGKEPRGSPAQPQPGPFCQELALLWTSSRSAAAQAGDRSSRAAGGIIPQHSSSPGKETASTHPYQLPTTLRTGRGSQQTAR